MTPQGKPIFSDLSGYKTEQQATHTPGPWHISPCYFGGILNHFEINGETDGVAVTKCEANASLIAAAPDLLAALKTANEVLRNVAAPFGVKNGNEAIGEARLSEIRASLADTSAAIAKACKD